MKIQANRDIFTAQIIFFADGNQVFVLQKGDCLLELCDDRLTKCCLISEISWNTYQSIIQNDYFNFKVEFQGRIQHGSFNAGDRVTISIALTPKLLSDVHLSDHNVSSVIRFLTDQQVEGEHSSFLEVNNWYLLSAFQTQDDNQVDEQVGYRTLWDYFELAILDSISAVDQASAIAAISQFYQASQFVEDLLYSEAINSEDVSSEDVSIDVSTLGAIQELTGTLLNLGIAGTTDQQAMQQTISQNILDLLSQALHNTSDRDFSTLDTTTMSDDQLSIHAVVTQFFQQAEWPIEENDRQDLFRTSFQGDNGKLICYGKILESENQFIFYSVAPYELPEDRLTDLAEFVCRANSGLVIGNFELDFEDKDIRYKTSIDVEDSVLDVALVRNLVMSNVYIMDNYLPGLDRVITATMSPEAAISYVES